MLRIAAWNTQRASNPDAILRSAKKRFEYVARRLLEYLRTDAPPDLFFLSEVTQAGPYFALAFNAHPSLGRHHKAEFFATRDVRGRASPCSFLLISPKGIDIDAELVGGPTTRRPYLRVRLQGLTIACVHLVANSEESGDEAAAMLGDLVSGERGGTELMMIGDMNLEFRDAAASLRNVARGVRFVPINPGVSVTYSRLVTTGPKRRVVEKVIDYAIRSGSVSARADLYWARGRHTFSMVDHAPVFYIIDNVNLPAPSLPLRQT